MPTYDRKELSLNITNGKLLIMTISKEIRVPVLWFLCTGFLHSVSNQCFKLQVDSFLQFGSYGPDKNSK